MSEKELGLLARWSQRRQNVEAEREAEIIAEELVEEKNNELVCEESSEAHVQTESANEADSPEALLTAEDLPDPKEIEVGGSFADFMGTNVDPKAKTDALRALWKQPHFNEVDGLVEYGLDYTNQPKLSAKVSAELAQKVFRHILKSEDEEAETEELASKEATSTEVLTTLEDNEAGIVTNELENTESITQDNLASVTPALPQNEPESKDARSELGV